MLDFVRVYNSLPDTVRKPVGKALQSFPMVRFYYAKNSYYREKGWVKSQKLGLPVDSEGEPIPWYTYPAIDFLEERVDEEHRVFEFGSGHSSLWYSRRVNEVVAVEDSEEWASEMIDKSPDNVEIVHQPNLDEYPTEVIDRDGFDIVVIDGEVRRDCVEPAMDALNDSGIVILDDFERWSSEEASSLRDSGYRPLPFVGPKAQRLTESVTAIFYQDENCVEI